LGDHSAVMPQVGVSGYFIDLAVVDPERPGTYLLGIECDGATYHSSKAARDRDRLRQQVLERLGWKLYRIWSTDWFTNSTAEVEKLMRHLRTLGD
jgi:very-short-patch-repair endonuclease